MDASEIPWGRFRICDDTSEQQRIDILQSLALAGENDPGIVMLASSVRKRAASSRIRDLAAECLNAIQHMKYEGHLPGEWFTGVPFIIADGGGNCEDLTVALVALCKNLGLEARCVWIDQPGHALNHVAGQIKVNGEWLWADPSIDGARLGESSYEALARLAPSLHPSDLKYRPARPYGASNIMNPRYPIAIPGTHPAGAVNTNLFRRTAADTGLLRTSLGLSSLDGAGSGGSGGTDTGTGDTNTNTDVSTTGDQSSFLSREYGGLPVWAWGLIAVGVGVGGYYIAKKF